jgi:hypothetical protein
MVASLILRKSSSEDEDEEVDANAALTGDITITKSMEITTKNWLFIDKYNISKYLCFLY